jgi:hypothetical protein
MSVHNKNVAPEANEVMHDMIQSFLLENYFPYSTTSSTKQHFYHLNINTATIFITEFIPMHGKCDCQE